MTPDDFRAALDDRIRSVLAALGVEPPTGDVSERLDLALSLVRDPSTAWLVYIGVAGSFPTADELAAFRRELQLADDRSRIAAALGSAGARDDASTGAARRLRIVEELPVVDAGHSATSDHNTGIQRVVRSTLPHWPHGEFVPVAWTGEAQAFRGLTAPERVRLLAWGDHTPAEIREVDVAEIVVPWRTTVVLPEVPSRERIPVLASLAESSGSRVVIVGHDAIPVVSADLIDPIESDRFALFLSVVKHAQTVCAVSESAASEFAGFASTLSAQGVAGPAVRTIRLAEESGSTRGHVPDADGVPLVICVGSHEPRKNQEAVLAAALGLQTEGMRFRLVFVGGGSRSHTTPFDRRVRRARARGHDVAVRRDVSDAELYELYAGARFSVLVSLHEGFGLPIVESLAAGVPVLTSDYGSMAEIAAGGGCLTVDPRSIDAIRGGMRRLLSDDRLLDELRAAAGARPPRAWSDYAAELWAVVREGSAS
ncbi:glycosyltransferase [Protaetiibacter larvae]|uniref:Glycosyltransferase family 4 protein n=1 Tax=Protaetiibacter larvae TaxID=2592654 RepID=A0A5C1Y5V6_9MICO|nr:glycosyltransferase [Protaetiibacter larvae]QEO08625.1 glycosyltransferase family 4 protein [Protaetiibacter larvae]